MLKKYKNGFIKILEERGLAPSNFIAEEINHPNLDNEFIIRVINTELTFSIRNQPDDPNRFVCKHNRSSFQHNPETETQYTARMASIDVIYTYFKRWLASHVKPYLDDLSEPDLWSEIGSNAQATSHQKITNEDTQQFSIEEKLQLKLCTNEFRLQLLKKFSPSEDELSIIDNRLSYLTEAVDRLNRIDWRGVALSSLIGISTALSLDTQQGKELFELFKHVFAKVTLLLQ